MTLLSGSGIAVIGGGVLDVFGAVKSLGEAVSTAALIWTERGLRQRQAGVY